MHFSLFSPEVSALNPCISLFRKHLKSLVPVLIEGGEHSMSLKPRLPCMYCTTKHKWHEKKKALLLDWNVDFLTIPPNHQRPFLCLRVRVYLLGAVGGGEDSFSSFLSLWCLSPRGLWAPCSRQRTFSNIYYCCNSLEDDLFWTCSYLSRSTVRRIRNPLATQCTVEMMMSGGESVPYLRRYL